MTVSDPCLSYVDADRYYPHICGLCAAGSVRIYIQALAGEEDMSAILCGYFDNPPDPDDADTNNQIYEYPWDYRCYLDTYYM